MSDSEKVTVQLFIRASVSNREMAGACPISQKWFMVYYLLVERQHMNLEVIPVFPDHPPAAFTDLGVSKHLPVAYVVSGISPKTNEDMTGALYDTDDALENLMSQFNCPHMSVTSSAFKVTEDLYRNFNTYILMNNPRPMLTDLQRLNGYLERYSDVHFLEGENITYADCLLMPKLQHLRVAALKLKGFEIPHEYRSVWRYIANMYELSAFLASCPMDRDIILHYEDKVDQNDSDRKSMLYDDHKTLTVTCFQ